MNIESFFSKPKETKNTQVETKNEKEFGFDDSLNDSLLGLVNDNLVNISKKKETVSKR